MNSNSTSNGHLPEILGVALVVCVGAIFWSKVNASREPTPPEIHAPTLPARPANVPSDWKPASPALRRQAAKSIITQLEAFKRDDYQSAVKFQSAALRRNFSSVASFRQMMQVTYPQFAAYKSVHFDKAVATPDGSRVQIAVRLRGRDGIDTQAVYSMIKEQGNFRVEGVAGGTARPGEVQAA